MGGPARRMQQPQPGAAGARSDRRRLAGRAPAGQRLRRRAAAGRHDGRQARPGAAQPGQAHRLGAGHRLAARAQGARVDGRAGREQASRLLAKPALATDWNISPDQLTYTFHLRRGVKWHDGAPFSGRDVVATLRKIQDPSVRAMHLRNNFEDLADISTAPGDDFTVIAHYRKPYFLAFRALATLSIYPAHLLETAGDMMHSPMHRAPVGTGPFRFEEWKSGDRISFVRNDQYWGRKAHLDRVVYRIVPDSAVAFQLLKRGEFDLYLQLQPQQWARDLEAAGLKASLYRIKFFNPHYNWIGWNEERPYFSDPRVRQAMNYVIDTEGIRNSFLLGLDRPTTCIFYLESTACDRSLVPRPYDPAQAARLLDEAGWRDHDGAGVRDKDGVPFRFTFLMNSDSVFL